MKMGPFAAALLLWPLSACALQQPGAPAAAAEWIPLLGESGIRYVRTSIGTSPAARKLLTRLYADYGVRAMESPYAPAWGQPQSSAIANRMFGRPS